jgi:hypothetical protein
MAKKNFWSMMNKGIKVNNNYQNKSYSQKEEKRAGVEGHQFKEDIGGNETNYKKVK